MTWEGREILCFLYPEDEDPGEDDAENVDEGQGQADQKQNPNIVIQARINNFGELPPPPLIYRYGLHRKPPTNFWVKSFWRVF